MNPSTRRGLPSSHRRALIGAVAVAVALIVILAAIWIYTAPAPAQAVVLESYETPLLATGRAVSCPDPESANCQALGLAVEVGDLDGDGSLEVVAAGFSWDAEFVTVWRPAPGDAKLALVAEGWNDTTPSFEAVAVALGDLDGDGRPEIVTGGRGAAIGGYGAFLSVWTWDGGRNVTRRANALWNFARDTYLKDVALADFDGDGETEILTVGYAGAGEVTLWNYTAGSLNREGRFTVQDPGRAFLFEAVSVIPASPVPRAFAVGTALLLLEVNGTSMRVVDSAEEDGWPQVVSRAVPWGAGFRVLVGGTALNPAWPNEPQQITLREVLVNATNIELGAMAWLSLESSTHGSAFITGLALSDDGRFAAVTGVSRNTTFEEISVLQLLRVESELVPYARNEWVRLIPGVSLITQVSGVRIADVLPGRAGPEVVTVGTFAPWLEVRVWGS